MDFKTKRTEILIKLIQRALPKDSRLVKIYTAKNNRLFYCLLGYQSNYFKVLRISDQELGSQLLEVPTFTWRNNPNFLDQLTTYIQSNNAWFKVKYNEYVALLYLMDAKNLEMQFSVEDSEEDDGLFYVELFSNRELKDRKVLPEEFQKIFKKFYLRRIINTRGANQQQVYITSLGIDLLNFMEGIYPQWANDQYYLDFQSFELPNPDATPITVALRDKQKLNRKKSIITKSDLKHQGVRVLKESRTWLLMLGTLLKEQLPSSGRLTPREETLLFEDSVSLKKSTSTELLRQNETSQTIQSDTLKESIARRSHTSMDGLLDEDTLTALKSLKEEVEDA